MSADDNAPEQARDDVLKAHEWRGGYFCSCGHELNSPWGFNRHLVDALEPVLAAERQEAAREALVAAAEDDGWFDPTNLQHHVEDFRYGVRAMQDRLRGRADGVWDVRGPLGRSMVRALWTARIAPHGQARRLHHPGRHRPRAAGDDMTPLWREYLLVFVIAFCVAIGTTLALDHFANPTSCTEETP